MAITMLANASTDKIPLTFDERLAAVEASIDRHHTYLENYLANLTRNRADAEDLISQLWVHVLRKFNDGQIGSLPILRRKAYQLFVDHYRKKVRLREDIRDQLPEQRIRHVGKEAYSSAEEAALKAHFWAEYPVELSESQREVLWLSARYGFTIGEIAARMKLPSSTVGDWLQRGRRIFAAHLNSL
jgi:RNA polymerase sigma factor (sigma-70 family)